MSSTFSANKSYELQATGDNNGTWGVKLDAVISTIDLNFGGRKNAVVSTGNVNVSAADAQNVRHVLSGTLTGNVTYTFPNAGSYYWVTNATTGNFTVTLASAAAGTSYVLPQGATAAIFLNPDNNNVELLSPQAGGNQLSVVNVAGNSNVTLTATQSAQPVIELIGALTGSINVIFPTASNPAGGNWIISNQTTGAFTITCKTSGGTGVVVAQGKNNLIFSDGTNIEYSFNDVSTVLGYTPANKAGDTFSGAVTVTGALTASSTLGVTGVSTMGTVNAGAITGTTLKATSSQGINCTSPQSTAAQFTSLVTNIRQWNMGTNASGNFEVYDQSGGAQRFTIDTTGHAVFNNNLTCNGAFNTNGISGTTGFFSSSLQANGQINSQNSFVTQTNPGTGAWYYGLINGLREWQWGVQTDGTFWIYDTSVGGLRLGIDLGGTVTVYQALVVGTTAQFNSNATVLGSLQVNGNTNTSATTTCNALVVNGSCTINPQLNCNTISCGFLTTNGNTLNAGPINAGSISCTTLNTNGNTLTCGQLNASGNLACAQGVTYNSHGGHTIGFDNSGTTLTFFSLGGSSGSWNFTGSDERIKTNITPPRGDALGDLNKLDLISFDYLPEHSGRHIDIGLSAQKIQSVIPEAITLVPPGAPDPDRDYKNNPLTDEEKHLSIDTLPLLARCIGAIKQLSARVEELEAKLAALGDPAKVTP